MSDERITRGLRRQLETRRRLLEGGHRPLGWKAGFGAPSGLERFRLTGPLIGFMTDASLVDSGAEVDISGWSRPVAEPELAVWIGRRLGEGTDEQEAAAAITSIAPAIELADVEPPPQEVEEILAGNIFHRTVTLGPPDETRAGGRLEGLEAHITVSGERRDPVTDLEALTGRIPFVVAHLANLLADQGESIGAGQVVITGSVVPPIQLTPQTTVEFHLRPLEAISVRSV